MAELVVTCPGQPDQVVELSTKPVTIGRGESCTVFVAEKKASRRHVSVRMRADGLVVAEDQDSSNGTWIAGPQGDRRILRRALEDGDELHIGDTRIRLRLGVETEAPLVSGTLQLTPAADAPASAPEPAAPAAPAAAAAAAPASRERLPDDARDDQLRAPRGAERKALVRGLVICAVALAVIAAVEVLLGAKADKQSGRKDAHLEALRVLEYVNKGSEAFQRKRDEFAARFPNSPKISTLDRYLEKVREREVYEHRKQDQLNILLGQLDDVPRSEARLRLLQLRRDLPGNDEFARKIRRGLDHLDRRRADDDREDFRALRNRVNTLLGASRPAHADRLVKAFDRTHDSMDADVKEDWRALRDRVKARVAEVAGDLWKRVDEEQDPAQKRALLAQAWPGLVGTKDGVRIGDKLRSAASLAAPRPGTPSAPQPGTPGSAPRPGAAPTVPTVREALLARAKKAEALLLQRAWADGRAALAKLVQETDGGRLQAEWTQRLGEVDQIIDLVKSLAEAANGERKPRRKLSSGSWKVTAADATAVTLESSSKGSGVHAWSDLPEKDVLTLLTPKRQTVATRHAVALLAANLGDRGAFVAALVPVYEKETDLAATNALVARHLYGRTSAPEGGYSAYKGEILDAAGRHRRVQQERIAFLHAEADRLLGLIAKDGAFKRLDKLRAMRDTLDKRREYALLAIFNTTHYPYPYNKGAKHYWHVQAEIDRRTAHAREIWDDPYRVKIEREGKLAKLLDAWDAVLVELDAKDIDAEPLKKKLAPYSMYVTGEPLTIRTFYRTVEEKELLAYNRWVREHYNPARTEVARDSERKQVAITNTYRMLIGYTAVVTPGSAPYESITKDNVVQILDQAKVEKMTPLRAVRVDNKLVMAARLHSEDMSRRGYFAHQAPPNPATGEGPTGPANRMQKQGYQGWGYSENIASSASPQQAHTMWIHSSGHHRNILSGWTDLGSGVGGRNFTQNFGNGGGASPKVQPDTSIRDRDTRGRGGARRPRGR